MEVVVEKEAEAEKVEKEVEVEVEVEVWINVEVLRKVEVWIDVDVLLEGRIKVGKTEEEAEQSLETYQKVALYLLSREEQFARVLNLQQVWRYQEKWRFFPHE